MALFVSFVLFSSLEVGKGRHTYAQALVKTPFNRWKNAKHVSESRKHGLPQNALVSAQHFVAVCENRTLAVSLQLDTTKKRLIERNRRVMSFIVEAILFLGMQELPLRGHRNSGPILLETPPENDGNIRYLLCVFVWTLDTKN